MKKIKSWSRAIHIGLMTLFWLSILLLRQKMSPRKKRSLARYYKRKWAKRMLHILGIKVQVHGQIPELAEGFIITPNHRSHLDIPVVMSLFDCSMLSKAEVAGWPVIGIAAKAVGTIFVQREDRNSRSASLEKIAHYLQEGYTINVFPEGTTYKSPEFGVFKPGVFNLANQTGAYVIPIRIEYEDTAYEWVAEQTAFQHFFLKPGWSGTVVHVYVGEPIRPKESGVALKEAVEAWIRGVGHPNTSTYL
jgi:1-acyl-sn-glycerol-3-phosphate acyltransferase